MNYSVTVKRHNNDATEVLQEREITADAAIDVMLFIQDLSIALEVGRMTDVSLQEVDGEVKLVGTATFREVKDPTSLKNHEIIEVSAVPKKKPKKDKAFKAKDVTDKVEIGSAGKPRKCSACGQPGHIARYCSTKSSDEKPTAYAARKEEKAAEPVDENPTLTELDRMAAEGLSQAELFEMFPSVPQYQIINAWEKHNHI